MTSIARVLPGERLRFLLLAALLFVNVLIVESNEVVATSGFVSQVGAERILWVWAADMLIIVLTVGAYSLVVDRTKRERLAIALCAGFSLVYVALYLLLLLGSVDWIAYCLLTVVNDQQWLIFPMLVWAIASDAFSTAQAKRLFPLLGVAAFAGGIFGNGLTVVAARWTSRGSQGSIELLLLNAGLLIAMVLILALGLRRAKISARQSRQGEKVLDSLREGLAFVREVPSYRYLTLAMILLGVGLNVVEYQLIASASQEYSQAASLEAFYATLRAVRIVLMLMVQGAIAGWLLKHLGFKAVFAIMPSALLVSLFVVFFWPALVGVVIGESLARITLEGVDEPSRRAFLGLVPDERRGRVGAFLDGYLYPFGSLLSCGVVGATLFAVGRGLLAPELGRAFYVGLACVCTAIALWAITRFRAHYDASMLNWRLKRRQRKSILSDIDI
jgi:AAA family ATP:ADP antiporter